MKKERDKKTIKKYKIFALVIFIALAISAARLYWEEDLSGLYAPDCKIEYGYSKCIDGILAIPFYNPNIRDITSMNITVPKGVETNVSLPATFNVNLPLNSGKTGILKLVACRNDINTDGFSIEWCCGNECYKGRMDKPNKEITVSDVPESGVPENGNLSETYPEIPKLEDCEKTSKRNFCIGDVAELKNNISLCYQINDRDVRLFCTGRISMNQTMCNEINDIGLKGACFESINLKKGLSG